MRILQIEYRLMSSIIFHYFYKNNKSLWYTLLLSEIHLTVEIWSFAVIKAYITNITRVYSKQVPGRPIGNHIHVHIYQKFKVRRKVKFLTDWHENLFPIYSWKGLDGSCMILSAPSINSNYLQLIKFNFLNLNNS